VYATIHNAAEAELAGVEAVKDMLDWRGLPDHVADV